MEKSKDDNQRQDGEYQELESITCSSEQVSKINSTKSNPKECSESIFVNNLKVKLILDSGSEANILPLYLCTQ